MPWVPVVHSAVERTLTTMVRAALRLRLPLTLALLGAMCYLLWSLPGVAWRLDVLPPLGDGLATPERVVVVLGSRGGPRESELAALAELYARLVADPRFVRNVSLRLDPVARAYPLSFLPSRLLHYLTPGDIDTLASKLEPAALERQLGVFKSLLLAAPSDQARRSLRADPLGLFGTIQDRLLASQSPLPVPPGARLSWIESGYFFTRDKRAISLVLSPNRPADDLSFCIAFDEFLQSVSSAVLDTADLRDAFTLHATGPHLIQAQQAHDLNAEVLTSLTLGILLALAVFLFAIRRVMAIVVLGLPWLVAATLPVVVCHTLGHPITPVIFSLLTIPALAAGSFAVRLYSRFAEDATSPESLFLTSVRRGAISAGMESLATLGIVVTLLLPSLMHWAGGEGTLGGAVAIAGIVAAWFIIHLGVPALMGQLVSERSGRLVPRRFTNFGLRHIANASIRLPHLMIAVAVLIVCYLTFFAVRIDLRLEPWWPYSPTPDVQRAEQLAADWFPTAAATASITLTANTLPELLERSDRLTQALLDDAGASDLRMIQASRWIVPSIWAQTETRARLLSLSVEAIEAPLRRYAADQAINYEQLLAPNVEFLRALRSAARDEAYLDPSAGLPAGLARRLRESIGREGPGSVRATVQLAWTRPPTKPQWARLSRLVLAFEPTASLSTPQRDRLDAKAVLLKEAAVTLVSMCLAAFAAAVSILGGWRRATQAMAPLAAAFLAALGLCELLDQPLLLADLLLFPPLAFLAIATVVHPLERWRECRPLAHAIEVRDPGLEYGEPERAALYSTVHAGRPGTVLVTMLGALFLMMTTGEHEGVRRLASVGIVGLLCLQVSVYALLPALMVVAETGLVAPIQRANRSRWPEPSPLCETPKSKLQSPSIAA